MSIVENEILIVRQDEGYRVLHGHLQLIAFLSDADEICVRVMGEGNAKVTRAGKEFMVSSGDRNLPLLRI